MLVIVFLIIITANFPLDVHVPAMPIIARELQISVSDTQLTISLFLLGYALFPIAYGALSDAYGRRKMALLALVVLFIGSVICAAAGSASMLLFGRFIQGVGTAGCMAMPRSIMRDLYQGAAMARVASMVGVAVELTLALSPALGGFLVQHFGWHSNFIFVAVMAIVTIASTSIWLKETNQHQQRQALHPVVMWTHVKAILSNPSFLRYNVCVMAAFSSAMAYFIISPFIVQNQLHYSAQTYGLITLLVTGGIVLGSLVNALLVKRYGVDRLIKIALFILLLSGVMQLLLPLWVGLNIYTFVGPSVAAFFALAFLFGNCMSGALLPFPKQAGMASSVYSSTQIGVSVFVSTVISFLPHDNSVLLAIIYLLLSLGALLFFCRSSLDSTRRE